MTACLEVSQIPHINFELMDHRKNAHNVPSNHFKLNEETDSTSTDEGKKEKRSLNCQPRESLGAKGGKPIQRSGMEERNT